MCYDNQRPDLESQLEHVRQRPKLSVHAETFLSKWNFAPTRACNAAKTRFSPKNPIDL